MKLVKKIYTFITAAACCAAISGIMPFSSSAEESVKTYGDLSYVSSDSDGDRIYDYIAIIDCNESVTKIEIPAEIEDIPVVEIESSAFNGCANLTSIIIPDSITSIGDFAFENCSGLTSITIPDSVTSIGDHAFYNCLTSITVSENNKYFSSLNGVLFNKDKTELVTYLIGNERTEYAIPDSVTSIGDRAFYKCSSLTSIIIPDSVTSIGDHAFYNCSSLTNITVSENNKYFSSLNGVLFNKDKTELITYPNGNERTEYTIPDSVTSIIEGAFAYCSNLITVKIPDSVTDITDKTFYVCSSLTSVTIPDSVTHIGYNAFKYCKNLTSIIIKNPNCEISNGKNTIWETATIYGYENSTAQAYAETYDRKFVLLIEYTETILGDISGNGKIDLYDAIEIAKAIMGLRTFTDEEMIIADFNMDGTVDLYDAIEIARALLPK